MTASFPGAIDVHAHFLTSRYRDEAIAAGHARPDGMPGFPEWSVEAALSLMDEAGIRTSMLSISSPGVHFGDDAKARSLARHVNEAAAKIVSDHPDRFGFFASLPLPDIDGALTEIAYAFDVLKADGVVLETNSDGVYPGDDAQSPVLSELGRRGACVFLHPAAPHELARSGPAIRYPLPMMEFMFETTRAVFDLIFTGTLERCPNLEIIVPHAGATIPVLADRAASMIPLLGLAESLDEKRFFSQLRRLHFDLAGQPVPRLLSTLLSIADPDRLLYGSDSPFTPRPFVGRLAAKLAQTPLLDEATRAKIASANALRLFPRFA